MYVKGSAKKNKAQKAVKKGTEHPYQRTGLVLDAGLFLIILVAVSIALIFISSMPKQSNTYYLEFPESDEYVHDTMGTILDSTVPRVEYSDGAGEGTEYVGMSVEQLVLVDLALRNARSGELNINTSSLEHGIERELGSMLAYSFGHGNNFVFTAAYASEPVVRAENGSVIFISDLAEIELGPDTASEPVYEVRVAAGAAGTKADQRAGNDEVVIRLYLI